MRTPEQRGRYGRWLVAAREGRGYNTAVKALAALAASGIAIGKSTYAEYEAGTKVPSRNHLPLLEAFWGKPPMATPGSGTTDPGVAAYLKGIDRLVLELAADRKAMAADRKVTAGLVAELRQARTERELTDARLRLIESELESFRARQGGGGRSSRSVPLGTA